MKPRFAIRAAARTHRRARLPLLALTLLALGGCPRAIQPPDPESALANADPAAADPAAAAQLMAEAEAAYARRPDASAVEESIVLWLRAAVADATDAAPIMGAVRAQTWLAEYAATPERRRAVARESVETAQWCRRREVANPACSYYLALAVGVQANQVRATATEGLDIIVRALENAVEGAEEIDQAGPRRVLALVYLRAPGWPLGPGDPDTGLIHAERAVELFPDFAPNWLTLGEARDETDDSAGAAAAYQCGLILAHDSDNPDATIWVADATQALDGRAGECVEVQLPGSKPEGQ